MDFTNKIILIASVLTALGVIVTTCVKVYKFIRKWEKWAEEQSEHNLDNYMSVLQLKIMSPYMPVSERLKAGDRYVKLNGNGEVKLVYNQLLEELGGSASPLSL